MGPMLLDLDSRCRLRSHLSVTCTLFVLGKTFPLSRVSVRLSCVWDQALITRLMEMRLLLLITVITLLTCTLMFLLHPLMPQLWQTRLRALLELLNMDFSVVCLLLSLL